MGSIASAGIEHELLLKLKEQSLAMALKALNAGAWSWMPGVGFLSWNERCFELFDQPPGPVSVDEWTAKVHEEDKENVLNTWAHIFDEPGKFEIEFRIVVNNSVRWIRMAGFATGKSDEYPEQATGVMIDITAEKQFNDKLRDANTTKDRFFSIIAHDLRSPFTSILGFSRLLNEEYDDFSDDERKMMIRQILNSTEITFQLLDNLLTWAKTQLGRIAFSPESFEIEPLILETINLAIPQAKMKGISLRVASIDKSSVFGDVNMIRTVLRNLISNSIKFSFEGAMITIETTLQKSKILLKISDTGTGMDEKTISSLFSLNEQVRSTKGTANEKGTGLGLILCKEFIEKNKGKIYVDSQIGKGTTFSFTIPLAK